MVLNGKGFWCGAKKLCLEHPGVWGWPQVHTARRTRAGLGIQKLTLLADRRRCYSLNEVGRVEKRAVSEFFGEGKIRLCKKFYGLRHPSLPGVASARRPSQNYVSGGLHCSAEVAFSEKSQILCILVFNLACIVIFLGRQDSISKSADSKDGMIEVNIQGLVPLQTTRYEPADSQFWILCIRQSITSEA